MNSLKGLNALVCGASQGIGEATARLMAELGARVTLLARSEDRISQIKESLPGEGHDYLALDLSKTQELASKFKDINKDYHILICNSGGPKGGPISLAEPEEYMEALKKHVVANSILFQALYKGMKKNNYGRVINVISTSVKAPIPNLGVSNTIRGAVANWAKTLSLEVAKDNITVNNVLPGYTLTPRLDNLIKSASEKQNLTTEKIETLWKAKVPMGRFAEAEEVASAICFLASPSASYINGVNLPVDGGRTACL